VEVHTRSTKPKETNRQIGPLFRNWLQEETLGFEVVGSEKFKNTNKDAILDASDSILNNFAREELDYQGEKGLDFVAKVSNKYVIGEAKFLTDFGGHQNAQFEDAKTVLKDDTTKAIKIAILDGVLYIPRNTKMHTFITENEEEYNIMSALVLREFLHQI